VWPVVVIYFHRDTLNSASGFSQHALR
jgi:hypothetical protein